MAKPAQGKLTPCLALLAASPRPRSRRPAGESPTSRGVFPRTVLQLLYMPGFDGALHASAVEVYQDKAYDLLAERAPLSVGSSKAGHKVSSGAGKSLIIGNKNAEGRGIPTPRAVVVVSAGKRTKPPWRKGWPSETAHARWSRARVAVAAGRRLRVSEMGGAQTSLRQLH